MIRGFITFRTYCFEKRRVRFLYYHQNILSQSQVGGVSSVLRRLLWVGGKADGLMGHQEGDTDEMCFPTSDRRVHPGCKREYFLCPYRVHQQRVSGFPHWVTAPSLFRWCHIKGADLIWLINLSSLIWLIRFTVVHTVVKFLHLRTLHTHTRGRKLIWAVNKALSCGLVRHVQPQISHLTHQNLEEPGGTWMVPPKHDQSVRCWG